MNQRFSHGLQFRGVYTFSKALDDGDNMNTSIATNSPAFVANPLNPIADYGRASFDIRNTGVINATYDLPFARRNADGNAWVNRLFGDWQISGIETLQSGLPFTPQLSYNPSNDGDTRNPVRPSINPEFHRHRNRRWPESILQSGRIHSAAERNLRKRRPQHASRPIAGRNRYFRREEIRNFRAPRPAVPRRTLQPLQPHQLQHAESRRVRRGNRRTIADRRRHHLDGHQLAPGPVRPEAVLVAPRIEAGFSPEGRPATMRHARHNR